MNKKQLAVAAMIAALTVLTAQHVLAKKGGTSILHLTVSVPMTGTGFDADASGSVAADYKAQGGAKKQSLDIKTANLDSNATYVVLASTTQNGTLTEVAQLTTDANGAINVHYSQQGQGKAHPHGEPLPVGLDPVSDLRTLEISIGGTQTVLSADMTAPEKLQYLVKRAMDNDGVDNDASAALRIKSNGSQDQLRIKATGLDASGTYFLAVNGNIASNLTTDASGGLSVTSLPDGAPSILDITGLAIFNSASNSVLSTTLP
jgi:hypothetical protein